MLYPKNIIIINKMILNKMVGIEEKKELDSGFNVIVSILDDNISGVLVFKLLFIGSIILIYILNNKLK
tara:strand:- start:363 stop:566 length:204 start_codon:yes stop_codon:yes gene_type:complete